jgi:hypothetical protein
MKTISIIDEAGNVWYSVLPKSGYKINVTDQDHVETFDVDEIRNLREWKKSAMRVMEALQPLEVAKELNIPLGETINEKVLIGIRKLKQILRSYVEWAGAVHEADCPGDDTCNCEGKMINDAVNEALK